MKNILTKLVCVSGVLLILGWTSPGQTKPEKDTTIILMKRVVKSISGLTVSEEGKVVTGKQRAIRRLRRLIRLSGTELQKAALGNVVKSMKEDNLSKFPEPEFIPDTTFDLLIRFNRNKGIFSARALKTAGEENKVIDALFNQIRDALKGGIMERNIRFFPGVNVIRISDQLFPEEPVPELLVLPSAGAGLEVYPGVILIKNRIEEVFAKEIQPLAKSLYTKKTAQKIRAESLMKNMFLRHAAHYTIPVDVELKGENRKTKVSDLKELFPAAEEVRADLTYLALIARMNGKEIVDDKLKEEVFLTFFLQKLADIQSSGENSPSGTLVTALYNKGGVKVGKNQKKLMVEMDLLTRSVRSLESEFADLFSRGSYTECAAFFKKNGEIPQNIKELIKITAQTDSE